MKAKPQTFRLTVLAVALMSAFNVAADEVEALIKPDNSVSIGVGHWSQNRPQMGIYDAMRDKGVYGLLDVDLEKRVESTGTWYKFQTNNFGLENREMRFDVLQQGNIGFFVEYNKTGRTNPMTFNTGLQGIGTTSMTVAGAGAANAQPVNQVTLGTTRDRLTTGFYKNLAQGLDFKLEFRNEEKSGTRPGGFGSQALLVVEPISYNTRQVEALLQYHQGNFQMSGGYNGSWFDNQNPLVWAQVRGAAQPGTTSSPNPVPLSQALGNQAHQFFVDGGYAFSKTTRANFKVAYTRATQDETLPTWGLAAPNNRYAGAPSTLDGRIDTTLVQLGLTSRPVKDLSLLAQLRYYDVKDKTPVVMFSDAGGGVYNTPHSVRTTSGKVEGTYRLPYGFSLTGGVDISDQDRSVPTLGTLYVPFRSGIDETTWRLQLRRSLDDTLNGTLAFLHSERRGSGYKLIGDIREDGINPLHVADRNRDKWRLSFDWAPVDRLSLQLSAEDARDSYAHDGARPYGLQNGSARLYALDANFTISDNWQLAGWVSHDSTKARELSWRSANGGSADANKQSDLKEVGRAFGASLRGKVGGKVRINANVDWHETDSQYGQTIARLGVGSVFPAAAGVTVAPLPDIHNKMTRIKLNGVYAIDKSNELSLDLVHERWRTDDWSWNFANGTPFIYGTTTDGTTVTAKQRQTADFIGVRYTIRWQ